LQQRLYLGNLEAKRDWGYAPEYVEAMWRMMQLDEPDDFVVATGETHTVREFVQIAFDYVGLDWEKFVEIDEKYFRPNEVDILQGDASKAERVFGWRPKVKLEGLVKLMVEADTKLLADQIEGRLAKQNSFRE
jgi:GDPmannose 4,6-dehydratase